MCYEIHSRWPGSRDTCVLSVWCMRIRSSYRLDGAPRFVGVCIVVILTEHWGMNGTMRHLQVRVDPFR